MKKILQIFALFLFALIFSCSKEVEENLNLDDSIKNEDASEVNSDNSSSSKSNNLTSKTACYILRNGKDVSRGTIGVNYGSLVTLDYTSNISGANVTWSIDSGNIQLISTSGNQATFRVYSAGKVIGLGQSGLVCSEYVNFSINSSASCPASMTIQYAAGVNGCDDFLIDLIGGSGIQTVKWYYSVKHINNSLFYTGRYSLGDRINAPLYDVNYDNGAYFDVNNHSLWVEARVTLTNGSTCVIKKSILLSCSGGRGNQ